MKSLDSSKQPRKKAFPIDCKMFFAETAMKL